MFCKKCGSPLNDNVKFCTACGTPVSSEKPVEKKTSFDENPAQIAQKTAEEQQKAAKAKNARPEKAQKQPKKKITITQGLKNKIIIIFAFSVIEAFFVSQLILFFLNKDLLLNITFIYIIAITLCLVIAECALLIINNILIKSKAELTQRSTPVPNLSTEPVLSEAASDASETRATPAVTADSENVETTCLNAEDNFVNNFGIKTSLSSEINLIPLSNLQFPCYIGRDYESCSVVIPDSSISRKHAMLEYTDGLYITDLGSANGSVINGSAISARTRITESDTIKLGRAEVCIVQIQSNCL